MSRIISGKLRWTCSASIDHVHRAGDSDGLPSADAKQIRVDIMLDRAPARYRAILAAAAGGLELLSNR